MSHLLQIWSRCFIYNAYFNQDISSWDVSAVSTMKLMFSDAINLDQDLSNWDVSSVSDFTDMFNNTPELSDDNKCFIHTSWKSNSNWSYSIGRIYGLYILQAYKSFRSNR